MKGLAEVSFANFDVHGLGNLPGNSVDKPFLALVRSDRTSRPSSSAGTCVPNETVLRRTGPVPGVMSIPFGFDGEDGRFDDIL